MLFTLVRKDCVLSRSFYAYHIYLPHTGRNKLRTVRVLVEIGGASLDVLNDGGMFDVVA